MMSNTLENNDLIQKAITYIYAFFSKNSDGHDAGHTLRVFKNAQTILSQEGGNPALTAIAALLHDLDDYKLIPENTNLCHARNWLKSNQADPDFTTQICTIIGEVSYKGAWVDDRCSSLESAIVQDADRLDAMGAIGIARAFMYGGKHGHKISDPLVPPALHFSFEEYKKSPKIIINHFYEKLFLLQKRMKTETGKKMAISRHKIMEEFISQLKEDLNTG